MQPTYITSDYTTALTSILLCEKFQDTSVETSLFQPTSSCPDSVVFLKAEFLILKASRYDNSTLGYFIKRTCFSIPVSKPNLKAHNRIWFTQIRPQVYLNKWHTTPWHQSLQNICQVSHAKVLKECSKRWIMYSWHIMDRSVCCVVRCYNSIG